MNWDLMTKFAGANLIDMLGMIRCGFELEFQKLEGMTKNCAGELDPDTLDHDLLQEDAEAALSDARVSDIAGWLPKQLSDFVKSLDANTNATWQDIKCACDYVDSLSSAMSDAEKKWMDSWKENALDENPDRYYERSLPYDSVLMPEHVELGDDGSVSGGEIRTVGALTADQFLRALKDVCKLDLEVDTGCSFHIHLSIDGMKHGYGKNLQFFMMQYLIENFELWPESVKARIKKTNYYKLEVSRDKYSMVHFHAQGTWEFRIFGNVLDELDGYRCLILACRAMQYAYRQVLAGKVSAHSQITELNLRTEHVLLDAIHWHTTVDAVLRKRGRNPKSDAAA